MAPRLIVLDESKQSRHRILSVGGVVADLADLAAIEADWAAARQTVGIEAGAALKYSMSWPGGPEQRAQLLAAVGELPGHQLRTQRTQQGRQVQGPQAQEVGGRGGLRQR
jgi:hypothetical protein